jgi:MATE family multidrug resistance protein
MLFDLNRTSRSAITSEASAIVKLALPMMVAQIAQVATGFVDMVMAGQVGTDDLAAVSLGASVLVMTYVTLMGVVSALNPIISHRLGSGEQESIGSIGRQGLWFGLLLGLFGMGLMLFMRPLLHEWLSLPDSVKDKVSLFITGSALGMPAALMHRALHAYSSSLHKTKPIMIVSLLGLALNIPLNYILIHGLFGLPALGGPGCGWATGLVFWFNFLMLLGYITYHRHFQAYGLTRHFEWPKWTSQSELLRLGTPIGMSFFLEVSLFSLIAFLIAKLGTVVVASHQAVLNVSSIVYMIPQSLAVALSVRVSQALGRQDPQHARLVCGAGLVVSLGIALITMTIVLLFRHNIISFYSSDPRVLAIGATLIVFSAIYQLVDAAQTVASGALRGYKLTTIPMLIHAVSFWGVGLGLGSILGLTNWPIPYLTLPMGVYGFWIALVISLSAAALLLVSYLAKASRLRMEVQHYRVKPIAANAAPTKNV